MGYRPAKRHLIHPDSLIGEAGRHLIGTVESYEVSGLEISRSMARGSRAPSASLNSPVDPSNLCWESKDVHTISGS